MNSLILGIVKLGEPILTPSELTILTLLTLLDQFSIIVIQPLGILPSLKKESILSVIVHPTFPLMSKETTPGMTGNLISLTRSHGVPTPTPPLETTSTTSPTKCPLTLG